MGSKAKAESAARGRRAADARAGACGPALYAALKPVAERVRDSLPWRHRDERRGCEDNISVMLTAAEARAVVAAVVVVEQYGGES